MQTKHWTLCALVTIALAGCAPTALETDYGRSVRQMINAQTFDPATLTTPSPKPVIGAEPNMVNAAVTALQESVSARGEPAQNPITIQFGSDD